MVKQGLTSKFSDSDWGTFVASEYDVVYSVLGAVFTLSLATASCHRIRKIVSAQDCKRSFVRLVSFGNIAGVLSNWFTMSTCTSWLPCKIDLEKASALLTCSLLVVDNHGHVETSIFEDRPRTTKVFVALLESFGPYVLEP